MRRDRPAGRSPGWPPRHHPFHGFLYVGLMLTASGPKVIEFNVRLGDPETQVVLPLIDEPLLPLLVAGAAGALNQTSVRLGPERFTGVVLASRGYPEGSESGRPIAGIDAAEAIPGVAVYHAGTAQQRRPTGDRRRAGADGRRTRRRLRGSDRRAPTRVCCRSRSTACSTATTSVAKRCVSEDLKSEVCSRDEIRRDHVRVSREPGRLARLRGGTARGRRDRRRRRTPRIS